MSISMNLLKSIVTRVFPRCGNIINRGFSDKNLLYTNVGLSVTLSAVGDVIVQNYEILNKDLASWDKARTRNMSVFGMTIGVFCHYWYNYLDRILPGYTIRIVAKKIVIDQFVCSPVCISTLFVTTSLMEGLSVEECISEFKKKGWILYIGEWTVWPPAQFINFYFLPTRFRVLYDNTVSLGYDVFTSYVKHLKLSDDKAS